LFARAQQLIQAAWTARWAFKSVGGSPPSSPASGSRLTDVDGNTFIDYVMSWGPLIHGHAPKGLAGAIARAARGGTSFGAPSPLEVTLAERVCRMMPSIERVRFVNSGTEAAMSAVRVARAATRRDLIIKFRAAITARRRLSEVQAGSGR
jgi:glutamate-1-semialdehyde 2,1-aminomutase